MGEQALDQTEEEVETTAAEDQADFEASFAGEAVAEPEKEEPAEEEAEPEEEEFEEGKVDDLEDKEPEVEAEAEPTDMEKLERRVRASEGKYGELKSKYETLAAAKQAPEASIDAPTKAQVSKALEDDESFAEFNEQFPEWANMLKVVDARATQGTQNSAAEIKAVRDEVFSAMDTRMASARDMGRLDTKHEGWEDTINSSEFKDFAYQEGPTPEQRGVYYHLNKTGDPQAKEMYKGFMETFPEWGEKYGSLLDSNDPKDAIKLLDQFAKHQIAQDDQLDEVEAKPNKKDRLKSNVAATKSSSARAKKVEKTEQEEFEEGFK